MAALEALHGFGEGGVVDAGAAGGGRGGKVAFDRQAGPEPRDVRAACSPAQREPGRQLRPASLALDRTVTKEGFLQGRVPGMRGRERGEGLRDAPRPQRLLQPRRQLPRLRTREPEGPGGLGVEAAREVRRILQEVVCDLDVLDGVSVGLAVPVGGEGDRLRGGGQEPVAQPVQAFRRGPGHDPPDRFRVARRLTAAHPGEPVVPGPVEGLEGTPHGQVAGIVLHVGGPRPRGEIEARVDVRVSGRVVSGHCGWADCTHERRVRKYTTNEAEHGSGHPAASGPLRMNEMRG